MAYPDRTHNRGSRSHRGRWQKRRPHLLVPADDRAQHALLVSTTGSPDESELGSIQQAGEAVLADAGLHQYEVSAFSREGEESRHNLNYWRFGDYIGLGAGATARSLCPTAPLFERSARERPQTIFW